jgi:hypothetical protein
MIPRTSHPELRASIVAAEITEFIPGAGPPPHKIPRRTRSSFQRRVTSATGPRANVTLPPEVVTVAGSPGTGGRPWADLAGVYVGLRDAVAPAAKPAASAARPGAARR